MTLSEFRAWFEGFTEEMDEAPSKKQWERIKKRVKEIDGTTTTERVFVERYWPPRQQWFYGASTMLASQAAQQCYNSSMRGAAEKYRSLANFNSSAAMTDLGRAEYKAEAA